MDSDNHAKTGPEPGVSAPVFKKRTAKANMRKRPAPPKDSDTEEEFSSQDETGQRVVKRRRKGGVKVTIANAPKPQLDRSEATTHAAERIAAIDKSADATKQADWYEEGGMDEKSLLGTTRKSLKIDQASYSAPDGTYRGQKGYSNFIPTNPNKYVDKFNTVGPIKAHSSNVRTVTITDYAPDVCKDYKQTGYCGYGDSCKFSHQRDSYEQGWALDKDWEIKMGGKKQDGAIVSSRNRDTEAAEADDPEVAMMEKIPFACIICKGPYKKPVMTRCEHYYCQTCAMQRYRKDPTCAACGAGTNGVFNVATQLNKLLEKKKARQEKLEAEKAVQDGGG